MGSANGTVLAADSLISGSQRQACGGSPGFLGLLWDKGMGFGEEGETGAHREHQRAGARFIETFTALVFIIYTLLILGAPIKRVINIKIFYRPVKIPQQK